MNQPTFHERQLIIVMKLHPNRKYFIDENYFEFINSEEKAYWLGWIASDGHLSKKGTFFSLSLQHSDEHILEKFSKLLSVGVRKYPIRSINAKFGHVASLTITSRAMVCHLKKHLGIPMQIGAKDKLVQFPELVTEQFKWAFLRGLFEGDGSISKPTNKRKALYASLTSCSPQMKRSIQVLFGQRTPKELSATNIKWSGRNAFEFLEKIYANSTPDTRLERKYNIFLEWKTRIDCAQYNFSTFHPKREFAFVDKKGTVYRGCGVKEFATEHGLNNSRLCDILNGKRKSHKGFSLLESKG